MTGIVPSADGQGYFIVAKDGGVFAFGDARFLGSLPSEGINARVAAVAPTYDNGGLLRARHRAARFTPSGTQRSPPSWRPLVQQSLPGRAVAIVCHRSLYQAAESVRRATQRPAATALEGPSPL